MCIQTRIQEAIAKKEALDAQIEKLERLEQKKDLVASLLGGLLEDYAEVAPEDLADFWAGILAIGDSHNLNQRILSQSEVCKLRKACENLQDEAEELRSQLAEYEIAHNPNPSPSLTQEESAEVAARLTEFAEELERQRKNGEVKSENSVAVAIAPKLESLYAEAQIEDEEKKTVPAVEVADGATPIPALTLWQPWASLVAEGAKKFETRSWATDYRGPLAIHAAKRPADWSTLNQDEYASDGKEWPLGAVVAIVNLVDCIEMTPEFIASQSVQERQLGLWQPGRFAWTLEIIRPVVPALPVSGGQKIWNWIGTSIEAELENLEKSKAAPGHDVIFVGNEYDSCFDDDDETTIESILTSKGFFQVGRLKDYDSDEKYETYRGWDIYYSIPNGGIVAIGLYNVEYKQPWDCSTEVLDELDPTFPKSLADFDGIVRWTRSLVDQLENLEASGQLKLELEFPDSTPEQVEEKSAQEDNYVGICGESAAIEQTELQKLLQRNSDFTFESLGVKVVVQSFFSESEVEGDDGKPAVEEVEEAQFTVTDASGQQRDYYFDAESLIRSCQRYKSSVETEAEKYAQQFLKDLKEEAIEPEPAEEDEYRLFYKIAGFDILVYPQYAGKEMTGATFRVTEADKNDVVFSLSLTTSEIADRTWRDCATDLIEEYREKEAARLERLANPHAKEEDKFIELVKISPAVGYLKRKDNGELISAYAAFANADAMGNKTATTAKSRAKKWQEHLQGSFGGGSGWKVEEPRKINRMKAELGAKQQFAYELKITGCSIGQLQKLAEEDLSLLPSEIGIEPTAKKIPAARTLTHTVQINSRWLASGSEEEMQARFEEELCLLGTACTSVAFLEGDKVVEKFALNDFEFSRATIFDPKNPEFKVTHLPSSEKFTVWKKPKVGEPEAKWRNSVDPYDQSFDFREGAAAHAVRQLLKIKTE